MSERWLLKKAAASDMTLAATWQRMKDLNCDRGSLGCLLFNLLPQFQKFRGEHDLFVQPHRHVPGGVPHRRLSVGVGNDGLKPAARGLLYRYLNGLTNLLQILGKCDFLDLGIPIQFNCCSTLISQILRQNARKRYQSNFEVNSFSTKLIFISLVESIKVAGSEPSYFLMC